MILLWKIFILLGNKQYFLQKIAFTRRSFGFLLIIYFWACCKSVIIQMSLMKGALFQKKKKSFFIFYELLNLRFYSILKILDCCRFENETVCLDYKKVIVYAAKSLNLLTVLSV